VDAAEEGTEEVSLASVKVGDEVVIVQRWNKTTRETATTVGRKYITAGRDQFAIDTGLRKGPVHGSAVVAYTVEQWAHEEAADALWAVIRRLGQCRKFGALTTDEIRDMTATLEGVAKKLEAT